MAKKATTKVEVKLPAALVKQAHTLHSQDMKFMQDRKREAGVLRADIWANYSIEHNLSEAFETDAHALKFVQEAGFTGPTATIAKRVILWPGVVNAARKARDDFFDKATGATAKRLKTAEQAFWAITTEMTKDAKPGAKRFAISDKALREKCLAKAANAAGAKTVTVKEIKADPAKNLPAFLRQVLAGYDGLAELIAAAKNVHKPEPEAKGKKTAKAALPEGKVAVDADIAALTTQIAKGEIGPVVGARRLAALQKKL